MPQRVINSLNESFKIRIHSHNLCQSKCFFSDSNIQSVRSSDYVAFVFFALLRIMLYDMINAL